MTISVVIPTKFRYIDLYNTIKSLAQQIRLPDEVIIIDQNESVNVKTAVTSLFDSLREFKQSSVALKYIHDPGITGLTQARNRAVKENECDYVLFLDDDVILERDFILNILEIHKKYPEIYGLSGIITNLKIGWTETFIRKIFEIGIFADKRIFVYSNPKYHNYEVVEVAFLPGGLTSFKKEVFQDFQFDENFLQYGLSEDVDFSFRVSQRYKIAITPKARLMHICSESGKADDGKFRENLVLSMHYFFRKNLRKNIFNYFCFTWLNVGFIYNAVLMAVFKHDFNVLIGNINGIKKIIKGEGSDFIQVA